MKRFYTMAELVAHDPGFGIALDGKPVRTPAKAELRVPSRALAEAIVAEWQGQGDEIAVAAMPLTRLASSAIDLVAARRGSVIDETANYAGTDLVCYRAAQPPELVRRQHAAWQPLVDWLAERYGAKLSITAGITPVPQPDTSVRALRDAVAAHEAMALAALRLATATSGSLVIALALLAGRLDATAAFDASELDETFEIEKWGEDPEQTKRRAALQDDLFLAERFARLLRE